MKDPFGRATPRSAVVNFLEACADRNYLRALHFLDLRDVPAGDRRSRGVELALQLNRVLDIYYLSSTDRLSNDIPGDRGDGLPADRELLANVETNGRPIEIALQRIVVPDGGTEPVWVFSATTMAQVPGLYRNLGASRIESMLPPALVSIEFLGAALWHWIALAVIVALAGLTSLIAARLLVTIVHWVAHRLGSHLDEPLSAVILNPIRWLFALFVFRAGVLSLGIPLLLRTYIGRLAVLLIFFAFAWLAFRVIDFLAARVTNNLTQAQRAGATSVAPLMRRSAKAAVAILVILFTLAAWGYDTTALLAGLGVGGLAVALAAQKTLEHLFGGLAIISDRPVLVGDFCRYGDKVGTIEDIGLRSTRIRTLERTVVTIPNGDFSGMHLENFARRDKIWFHPLLQIRKDASADQIRYLLVEIRKLLYSHPKVDPAPARIRLLQIGPASIDLEVFSYIATRDFDEFLEVQEDLLLRIMQIIAESGTALAFPSQVDYIRPNPDPEDGRVDEIARTVRSWGEQGQLLLPKFPPEKIAELAGTVEYPPRGSAVRNGS